MSGDETRAAAWRDAMTSSLFRAKSVMPADTPPLGRHELDVSDREQE